MDDAKRIRAWINTLPELEGLPDALLQELERDRYMIPREETKGNQGMGIIETVPEELAVRARQLDYIPGFGVALDRLDLVAEDPLMSGKDAVFFILP